MIFSGLQTAALLAAATTGYIAVRGIYLAYFHPLSKIPGPKHYAFTDIFHLYHHVRGTWHLVLKDLHDKYGPVVRYTPNDVSTITPDAWRSVYGHKAQSSRIFRKDKIFYGETFSKVDHVITADYDDHRRMRRVLAHAFSEKALRGQEDVLKHYTDLFLAQLTTRAAAGEPVNMVMWYNYATFDLIGDLAFGKSFGNLETGKYNPWVSVIFDSVRLVPYMHVLQRHRWLGALSSLIMPKRFVDSFADHARLSRETAMQRIDSGNTEREDFMSYILRHNNDGSGKGLSEGEIAENATILITAGSETTATLLSGATFQLLANRDKYDALVREVRSTFASEDEINMVSVGHLEYLTAVLSESFRMYPPVPIGLPRVTPEGGEVVDGYYLPAKTSISVPQWSAYQSALNFHKPQSFVPERWLADVTSPGSTSPFANDKRDVMQPFSAGPRNCIGKNLANAEMRLILTRLLYNFDLDFDQPADGTTTTTGWASDQKVFLLWDKGPLMVRLTPVRR
ncbi:cytochrome P450 [Microdochium trichocladiopsis]|uniref:Cytochrome P450 n=1 Tax=Microdochium trichocladiopsis TaxID=1682393 RepID=A0A9P8Y154_9PEZI|nr:cytochrome P450 [Microdochium trichocladiopsis]KAH7027270.1 cytochrome P450 [Microdochium trichocladiopsis]